MRLLDTFDPDINVRCEQGLRGPNIFHHDDSLRHKVSSMTIWKLNCNADRKVKIGLKILYLDQCKCIVPTVFQEILNMLYFI